MKRWHEEVNLMRRRWRQELANHTTGWPLSGNESNYNNPYGNGAPPSCAVDVDCHCSRGIGTMRKMRPHGCSRVGCLVCHFEKLMFSRLRRRKYREACEEGLADYYEEFDGEGSVADMGA